MKHSTLSLLICIGGCFSACSPTNEKVNPLTQHEDEITNIIAEMTLEEKINMLHGKNMFSSAGVERLNIPDIEVCRRSLRHSRRNGTAFMELLAFKHRFRHFLPDRLCPCSYMEYGNGIQIRRGNGCRS